ncbi:MAG: hypothetical protein RRZ64_06990 [Rikenellaceae bacterium]
MKTMKKIYATPTIEMIEVCVEQGIAASGGVIVPPRLDVDDSWN